jgi:hypothetical protein
MERRADHRLRGIRGWMEESLELVALGELEIRHPLRRRIGLAQVRPELAQPRRRGRRVASGSDHVPEQDHSLHAIRKLTGPELAVNG